MPILTIAIPTWNRANILDKALQQLLPQIYNYKSQIEIIVSDNASNDHTNNVIKKHLTINTSLNIIHYTQIENTGFYGNFKKCRELSTGNYFWLLSDNDLIANNLVDYIINILNQKKPSFIFLKDWKHSSTINKKKSFTNKSFPVFEALEKFNYKTTLISAVIFKNDKTNDKEIFIKFKGNTFLGFALFLQSLKDKKDAVQIEGTSLFINVTKVSFNAFKSFAEDLTQCFDYAINKNLLPKKTVANFIDKLIYNLTVKHYILFRATGKLHGKRYEKNRIDKMLADGFGNYNSYHKYLKPLQHSKKITFYYLVVKKHFVRLLNQFLVSYI